MVKVEPAVSTFGWGGPSYWNLFEEAAYMTRPTPSAGLSYESLFESVRKAGHG